MSAKFVGSIIAGILFLSLVESKLLDTSKYFQSRQKRAIIWSDAGISWVQFIFGLGLPLEVEHHAITLGTVFKAFYELPTNASVYTQPSLPVLGRSKRSTSRWVLYEVLEHMIARYNNGDGKSCILKNICELAHSPLEQRSGLLAEIVTAILKPSLTEEEFLYPSNMDYVSAEKIGKTAGHCNYHYPNCKLNLLEQYSRFLK
ncbi:uncharacterized protein LOC130442965 [Diorhabda sublineata]|uniref:uncharacterized protein LOC130442965 n=1 Tax=Diorhabda sublineata TaxID=1163346 RepID=UPI0024E0AB7B|nr:uncharacterized protein LOC130442965 [Diorhabda sublineata]